MLSSNKLEYYFMWYVANSIELDVVPYFFELKGYDYFVKYWNSKLEEL